MLLSNFLRFVAEDEASAQILQQLLAQFAFLDADYLGVALTDIPILIVQEYFEAQRIILILPQSETVVGQ